MLSLLSGIIATLVTVPVLALIMIYFISMKLTKNKKKSFHHMVDYSTIFFILSVYALTYVIWERSFLWWILLFLIVLAMMLLFLQWKLTEDIQFKKLGKLFLRFNFLLFFTCYFGLMIYGLINRVVTL